MWEFSGKKLRKDGTLGSTNGGMGFDVAWIERQKLPANPFTSTSQISLQMRQLVHMA
jgi:hypothetical protein